MKKTAFVKHNNEKKPNTGGEVSFSLPTALKQPESGFTGEELYVTAFLMHYMTSKDQY